MMPIIDIIDILYQDTYVYQSIINFVLVISLSIFTFNDLKKLFVQIEKRYWIAVLILVFVGIGYRLNYYTPGMLNPDSSEWEYKINAACITPNADPRFKDFPDCSRFPQGGSHQIGFPLTLVPVFTLFGVSSEALYYFNILLGGLSIALIFVVGYLMFKNANIGLIASALLSLNKTHIYYTGTGEVESLFIFTLLLLVIYFFITISSGRMFNYIFFILLFAFFCNIRKESIAFGLSLIIFGVISFMPKSQWRPTFLKFLTVSPILILFTFNLGHFVLQQSNFLVYKQAALSKYWSMDNLVMHLNELWYYSKLFVLTPVFYFGLVITGLLVDIRRYRQNAFLMLWYLTPGAVYLAYFVGLGNYFVDMSISLLLLYAAGIYSIVEITILCTAQVTTRKIIQQVVGYSLCLILLFSAIAGGIHSTIAIYKGQIREIRELTSNLDDSSILLATQELYNLARFETKKQVCQHYDYSVYMPDYVNLTQQEVDNLLAGGKVYFIDYTYSMIGGCDENNKWRCKEYQDVKDNYDMTFVKRVGLSALYKVNHKFKATKVQQIPSPS